MKYREHRSGLRESRETLVELEPTRQAIAEHINSLNAGRVCRPDEIEVRRYDDLPDNRVGWERTYVVVLSGKEGVLGFTDQPLIA